LIKKSSVFYKKIRLAFYFTIFGRDNFSDTKIRKLDQSLEAYLPHMATTPTVICWPTYWTRSGG